jgi:hypothetical protein
MARKYNSEGIKMMFGGACAWNQKALAPVGSCCFCEETLAKVGRVYRCIDRSCKAIFILQENGLLNYLGKLS